MLKTLQNAALAHVLHTWPEGMPYETVLDHLEEDTYEDAGIVPTTVFENLSGRKVAQAIDQTQEEMKRLLSQFSIEVHTNGAATFSPKAIAPHFSHLSYTWSKS